MNQTNVNPLVSICCLTYNHAPYIRDAIEGFLMQKTNFPVEILIHDDASTDGTADIIREYEAKYPDIIKPIYQKENQYSKGVRISCVYQFPRARGKYIALCEGDDYWTDPYKLQKQVDFLEANLEYAGCAHQTMVIYENIKKESHEFKINVPEIITINDLLSTRIFHTSSFIFKSEIIRNNSLPNNVTAGDRALFLLVSSFGKIKFMNEPMAIYRKNNSGISSWVTVELMEKDKNIVPWISKINPDFPKYRYLSFIYYTILTYPKKLSLKIIFKNYFLYILFSFSYFPKNLKNIIYFNFITLPKLLKKIHG